MRIRDDDSEHRTVFCGNLSEEVTDDLLYELFNQAGPVESVRRPRNPNGNPKLFAFIIYKHECTVPYATELLRGEKLFNRYLNINTRNPLRHIPVLDTHLTEFTKPRSYMEKGFLGAFSNDPRNNYENYSYRDVCYRIDINDQLHHSNKERDSNKQSSWTELNALRDRESFLDGQQQNDPQGSLRYEEEFKGYGPSSMPDFNALLQMGQQMIFPGLMGLPGISLGLPNMPSGDLGPGLDIHKFPSILGRASGGEHRIRKDFHERRGNRRDHPYRDWQFRDHQNAHRHHNRGYYSSHFSHDCESRDRKSY